MKSTNRREFLRLATISTAAAALAGCSPAATPTAAPIVAPTAPPAVVPTVESSAAGSVMTKKAAGQTIITWQWDKPEFNKVIEDYVKEASGVTTNGLVYGGDDVSKKIATSSAAGTGLPDAFKFTSTSLPQLVEMGAVLDITLLVEPYKDLLPKVAWEMLTYQGKIYGVAANSPASGLFWRYDICEKYKIDPDQVKTWDDFIEAGKKMATDSGGKNFLMYTPAAGIGSTFTAIRQQYRAEILTSDMKVAIGPESQPWIDALALSKKLLDAKISTVMDEWTEPWYQAIKDGSLASYPIGTWFVETIKQQAPDSTGKWYFTPFAVPKAGMDPYTNSGSASCAVSSQSKNVDAAFEWVKAWTLDPHGTLDIGLKTLGISCISNAALNNEFVKSPHPLFAKAQPYWLVATEAFTKSTYFPPVTKLDGEANNIFNTEVEKWWTGGATTDQFLTNVQAQLKAKLKI
jgi:lactose/L-arabinose transport system substrate-binding protein